MCFTAFFISAGADYDNAAEKKSESVKATTKDNISNNSDDKIDVSLVVKEDGKSFTVDSDIVTRDLLYDEATNKQFITVQDRDGNVFYIIIDYDAPVNEEEEQYQTYFLSPVSTDDLAALSEQTVEEKEPPVCNCVDKCTVGSIKMDCPVCVANRNKCTGKEPEPEPEPEPTPEPVKERSPFHAGAVLFLLVLLIGGGVFGYIKFIKPKNQTNNGPDPDDLSDNDPDNEDDSDWDDNNDDDYGGYDDSYDDDAEDYSGLDDDYDDTDDGEGET